MNKTNSLCALTRKLKNIEDAIFNINSKHFKHFTYVYDCHGSTIEILPLDNKLFSKTVTKSLKIEREVVVDEIQSLASSLRD